MKKWLFLLLNLTTLDDSYAKEAQPSSDTLTISQNFLNKTSEWIIHHRKPPLETKLEFSSPIMVTGFVCFIGASISSAGGVGGGGLFMPILTIAAGLDLKAASSFSAFIDFDIAILSQTCMLLGVSVGVICNVVFPEWLITILFAVFSRMVFPQRRAKPASDVGSGKQKSGKVENRRMGWCEVWKSAMVTVKSIRITKA